MKPIGRSCLVALLILFWPSMRSQAQILEIITAAIKAADIAVQKVQNVTIGLQNAQKELENELSKLQLGQIGDWESKFKDIYSEYFTELWKVKTAISYFQEVTAIIAQQSQLVAEYKQAYSLIRQDKHFTPAELAYIYSVYSGIIDQSVKSLDEIVTVLTPFSLQMSDAARLQLIKQASTEIERQTTDLRNFNNQAVQISLQRSKDEQDINSVKSLYGL
ncbi:MAG TPA: hypothetical protein VHE34_21140 [Puia sp.]|uniref:conjugal transfer protein TraI n=1 Tax=Puia sp. TaxID=2045100 RepID=UPI002C511B30|nr:conjugal transfer protein TraI [Puia sp.]HVU97749.1 hypothetical protein [Puia sp.]